MENNLEQFSDEELDIVTNYLIESAKTRFNYSEFKESLGRFDNEFIDYYFLNTIIMSKAGGINNQEIAASILPNILLSGHTIDLDDLIKIVEKKEEELGLEILAAQIAMDSLQSGVHPTDIVHKISSLL